MDSHNDTTILHSSTDADFLATLPTLVGHSVSNSILVVPFAGKRTHGAMRIDLPPVDADVRVHERLISMALGAMSRIDWCDTVLFAVYTDETFPAAFAGHERLVDSFSARFHAAGFAVRDAFCIAGDGWASWYDDDAPPFDGRPLDEITSSPLASAAESAREGRRLPAFDAAATLPTPDPRTTESLTCAVDALLTEGVERNAFGMVVPASLPDSVDFVETLLQRDAADTPVRRLAQLTALSIQRPHRDEMMLQVAFGRKAGRRARAENERWLAVQAKSGMSMDDVMRREFEAEGGPVVSEMGDLLIGERSTRPRPARIRRAIDILRYTIAHLPVDLRPDLLCMLAWLHWSMGASAVAGAHLDAALAIDPEHGMAGILYTLISSGKIPQWIFAHYNDAGAAMRSGRAGTPQKASATSPV